MKLEDLPVRVVCATKLSVEQFLARSPTGRSLKAFIGVSKVEIRLFSNNTAGLGEVYNIAIQEAMEKPAILVFMHDDVIISDFYWADRVRAGVNGFDVIGLVGNKRRLPNQPGWIMMDLQGRIDDLANLSGAIGLGLNFPPERVDVFGATGVECKLMDGVFLAASSTTLSSSGLRFDPVFKFHFYDMDFCRSAEMLKLRMGTIPLSVVHASYGKLDQQWMNAYETYLKKWNG